MKTDLSFCSDYLEGLSNMRFLQNMKFGAWPREVFWKMLLVALGRMLHGKLRDLNMWMYVSISSRLKPQLIGTIS